MHLTKTLAIVALVVMCLVPPAAAQSRSSGSHTVAWTVGGVAIGFSTGLWVGLSAFDDAVDSDRKVWTTAIAGAAVGGVIAYLITRPRQPRDRTVRATPPEPAQLCVSGGLSQIALRTGVPCRPLNPADD